MGTKARYTEEYVEEIKFQNEQLTTENNSLRAKLANMTDAMIYFERVASERQLNLGLRYALPGQPPTLTLIWTEPDNPDYESPVSGYRVYCPELNVHGWDPHEPERALTDLLDNADLNGRGLFGWLQRQDIPAPIFMPNTSPDVEGAATGECTMVSEEGN